MKEEKTERRSGGLLTRLRKRYGSPSLLPDRELVILRGRRGATVYGCRKILAYSPREILLSLGREAVLVEGERLYCSSFTASTVTVEGDVRGVSYRDGETKDRDRREGDMPR